MVGNKLFRTVTIFTLSLFVLSYIGWCMVTNSLENNPSPKHLLQWAATDKMLIDFTDEEEKKILNCFNVVIPELEENAHVHSFYFDEEITKGSHVQPEMISMNFVLEIDGVKDYEAFFSANAARIDDNGIKGKSWNEILNLYPPEYEYYLTYFESFKFYSDCQSDQEEEEMAVALKSLYNEIYESKNNYMPNNETWDYYTNSDTVKDYGMYLVYVEDKEGYVRPLYMKQDYYSVGRIEGAAWIDAIDY